MSGEGTDRRSEVVYRSCGQLREVSELHASGKCYQGTLHPHNITAQGLQPMFVLGVMIARNLSDALLCFPRTTIICDSENNNTADRSVTLEFVEPEGLIGPRSCVHDVT